MKTTTPGDSNNSIELDSNDDVAIQIPEHLTKVRTAQVPYSRPDDFMGGGGSRPVKGPARKLHDSWVVHNDDHDHQHSRNNLGASLSAIPVRGSTRKLHDSWVVHNDDHGMQQSRNALGASISVKPVIGPSHKLHGSRVVHNDDHEMQQSRSKLDASISAFHTSDDDQSNNSKGNTTPFDESFRLEPEKEVYSKSNDVYSRLHHSTIGPHSIQTEVPEHLTQVRAMQGSFSRPGDFLSGGSADAPPSPKRKLLQSWIKKDEISEPINDGKNNRPPFVKPVTSHVNKNRLTTNHQTTEPRSKSTISTSSSSTNIHPGNEVNIDSHNMHRAAVGKKNDIHKSSALPTLHLLGDDEDNSEAVETEILHITSSKDQKSSESISAYHTTEENRSNNSKNKNTSFNESFRLEPEKGVHSTPNDVCSPLDHSTTSMKKIHPVGSHSIQTEVPEHLTQVRAMQGSFSRPGDFLSGGSADAPPSPKRKLLQSWIKKDEVSEPINDGKNSRPPFVKPVTSHTEQSFQTSNPQFIEPLSKPAISTSNSSSDIHQENEVNIDSHNIHSATAGKNNDSHKSSALPTLHLPGDDEDNSEAVESEILHITSSEDYSSKKSSELLDGKAAPVNSQHRKLSDLKLKNFHDSSTAFESSLDTLDNSKPSLEDSNARRSLVDNNKASTMTSQEDHEENPLASTSEPNRGTDADYHVSTSHLTQVRKAAHLTSRSTDFMGGGSIAPMNAPRRKKIDSIFESRSGHGPSPTPSSSRPGVLRSKSHDEIIIRSPPGKTGQSPPMRRSHRSSGISQSEQNPVVSEGNEIKNSLNEKLSTNSMIETSNATISNQLHSQSLDSLNIEESVTSFHIDEPDKAKPEIKKNLTKHDDADHHATVDTNILVQSAPTSANRYKPDEFIGGSVDPDYQITTSHLTQVRKAPHLTSRSTDFMGRGSIEPMNVPRRKKIDSIFESRSGHGPSPTPSSSRPSVLRSKSHDELIFRSPSGKTGQVPPLRRGGHNPRRPSNDSSDKEVSTNKILTETQPVHSKDVPNMQSLASLNMEESTTSFHHHEAEKTSNHEDTCHDNTVESTPSTASSGTSSYKPDEFIGGSVDPDYHSRPAHLTQVRIAPQCTNRSNDFMGGGSIAPINVPRRKKIDPSSIFGKK